MKTSLVTGGTGFLGEHLVRFLAGRGDSVRVLARSTTVAFDDLESVDVVCADINAGVELEAALAGVDGVFHLAGMVSRDPDDTHKMMRVHVDGTRRVLRAAAAAGVRRVVVASSSGTVAVSDFERVHTEDCGYATEVVAKWPYYESKVYQEKVAFELGKELGLEVVVVNPSLLLGPGDRRLSSTKDVLQIPARPDPGGSLAAASTSSMSATPPRPPQQPWTAVRPGERYLLGGPNWSVRGVLRSPRARLQDPRTPPQASPQDSPRSVSVSPRAPTAPASREPPVDRVSIEMGEHFWYVDSSKAERELGFQSRDPGLTLHDTIAYLRRDLG
nr:NAD-dependent epimerase/dehydratase family protein [uncultured Brevundimonas sp.]